MKNKLLQLIKMIMKVSYYGFFLQIIFLNVLLANGAKGQKNLSVKEVFIDLQLKDASIVEAFNSIESKTNYEFNYNRPELDLITPVNINSSHISVADVLMDISKQTGLKFRQVNRSINVDRKSGRFSKGVEILLVEVVITGKVTDETGESLPGINVIVKGTSHGSVTDVEGNYKLEVPNENSILVYSSVGYMQQEVLVGKQTVIDLKMTQDVTALQEIVVTALGINKKKESLGYSTTNLSGDQVSTAKESNIVNTLTGKIAGIVVTPASSGMGGSSRLVIRGNSSIGGNNQPLYVVDGIPINNAGFGSAGGSGTQINNTRTDYGTGISDLNPDDIESMSVLKGPNAAALYGARAANGVIMITTKSGKQRKGVGVSYTANVMVSNVNENTIPVFQNEYGQGSGGVFDPSEIRGNWGSKFDDSAYQTVRGVEKTYSAQPNNVIDYFETGMEVVQTIALEGGNEDATVRFSYTNFNGKGILPNSTLNKHNFNLRAKVNLTNKLSVDAKATYFLQSASNRPVMGWSHENNMRNLYHMPRNGEIKDYEEYGDEFTGTINPYEVGAGANNYWTQYKNTDDDFRNRFQGFVKATYAFNESLSAFARIGTDALTHTIQKISPYGHWIFPRGRRSDNMRGVSETNADFLLMFNKTYGDFSINLNAGGNYRYGVSQGTSMLAEDFKLPTSTIYTNAEEVRANEWKQRNSIYSLYFSGEVGFKEMAYLSFSGRNDWDSRMWTESGSDSDYSFFYPSVSLSLLGNKIFGIENSFLSFSKLRMSYSGVGSGGTKNDQFFYSLSPTAGYFNTISVSRSKIFDDPNLVPERTKSLELGLEFKLFRNRLYVDLTYYKANTFDQIVNAPVDASTGFEFMRTNIGEISNKGFELLIGGTPVQTNNFFWDVSFNMAKNTNILESFIEGTDSYLFNSYDNFSVKTKIGGQIGDIYGRGFVYEDGKMIVDGTGLPINGDEKLLGNYQPDMTGGLSNTFSFKNLELSFLIDMRIGGEAYSYTDRELNRFGLLEETVAWRDGVVLDAVVNTGTDDSPVYVPNTVETNAQAYYERLIGIDEPYVYDLTNVRLREVVLTYSFPSAILDNIFINRISLSLVGRNLFFLYKNMDGADPESSVSVGNNGQGALYYNQPSTRNIGFNLNISF